MVVFLCSKNIFGKLFARAEKNNQLFQKNGPGVSSIQGITILRRAREKNKNFQNFFLAQKKVIPPMCNIFRGELTTLPDKKVTPI